MTTIVQLPHELEQRARALHREAFVFDACLPSGGIFRDEETDIQNLPDGGVNGANVTIAEHQHNFLKTIESNVRFKKLIGRHTDKVRLATSAGDLLRCKRDGKVGFVMHFQDGKPIEDNLDYLSVFYDLGLRVFQLTYNMQGYLGTGCCERHDAGLSTFGIEAVAECNRLGILIDLSHCGHGTARDAIQHSKAPVAFTHAGVYALCPAYGRNKPDDLLKAVANTGGVIGVTFFPPFAKRNPKTHQVLQGTLDDVLDQVDYLVKLVGVDHVGFGSDLSDYYARTLEVPATSSIRWFRPLRPDVFGAGPTDRYDPFPTGLDSHARLPNLTRGLVQRGYNDEGIKKILGGNWLRLFQEVWKK